jgi:hypothetical protein
MSNDSSQDRVACRCRSLDGERGGWAVAGDARLAELSPCSLRYANCAACLSGEQHRSHVLYGRHNGRRFAVYVPEELVDEVSRCIENGRALQDLLMQAGPRYVKALKRARKSTADHDKS